MNDFEILVDSSSNIPADILADRNIHVIPYYYNLNGMEKSCFEQDRPFPEIAKEYYDNMRNGAEPRTSLIPEARFVEACTPFLREGKDVIIITISSGISGTYQQALFAKQTLEEEYPNQKVFVCDSANASLAEGMLAMKVADLRDLGESAETCVTWFRNNVYKMNSWFTVDDLKYLRRGGRISTVAAIAGSLLNIKPVLKADGGENAKIVMASKVRGRKKALTALAEMYQKHACHSDWDTVAIAHADCEEEALELADKIKEMGASNVIVEYYDLCSGSHVGPGTIALFFMGTNRRAETQARETEKKTSFVPSVSKI